MFSEIYGSWKDIQKEKFGKLFDTLGKEFFLELEGKMVLDIGAGSGYLEEFLLEKGMNLDIICLEPDRKMIKYRRDLVIGRAEEMPFREGFDAAFCFDTIHLLGERFAGCLKKGGILLASLFFNDDNFEERREMLLGKLLGFELIRELVLEGRENEIVILARK